MSGDFDVVTGAFSYSGAAIAREVQASGRRVRTLTGHPGRASAGSAIEVRPLDFADPAGLTERWQALAVGVAGEQVVGADAALEERHGAGDRVPPQPPGRFGGEPGW